jgi:multiple sugar transport system substrate-binding protein
MGIPQVFGSMRLAGNVIWARPLIEKCRKSSAGKGVGGQTVVSYEYFATLADIPQGWEAFWSFWCDQVQPAVRKALGRDDIWGVGLPMSVAAPIDTGFELTQFQLAYQASWLSRDRRVQIDDPKVREGMVKAMSAYTGIWRKGCIPPDAVDWDGGGNNKAFLAQTVVMTVNP